MVARGSIVLVVEDDAALRELYRQALTLEGYAVVAVEDGVDALRYIDGSRPPDAVVLDLNLPRLNGHGVRQELQSHPETSDIPIVVVTGEPVGITNAKVACVLTKPVDVNDLISSLEKCLRQRKREP
jgi:CheY-like chemotaxis protein